MGTLRSNSRTRLIGLALSSARFAFSMAYSPFLLQGQLGAASLSGIVQDPRGAGIGGDGSVILEAAADGVQRVTRSDQGGSFRFSGLPAGTYTLSIRVPGFDSLTIKLLLLGGEQRSFW